MPSCKLCKHNPSRRCAVNFDKKYLVNDVLKAKCQAVIRVEIVERTTNQPIESSELREEMILQMAILDGNTYDAKFEAGMEGDFEACILLMNNKVRDGQFDCRSCSACAESWPREWGLSSLLQQKGSHIVCNVKHALTTICCRSAGHSLSLWLLRHQVRHRLPGNGSHTSALCRVLQLSWAQRYRTINTDSSEYRS